MKLVFHIIFVSLSCTGQVCGFHSDRTLVLDSPTGQQVILSRQIWEGKEERVSLELRGIKGCGQRATYLKLYKMLKETTDDVRLFDCC